MKNSATTKGRVWIRLIAFLLPVITVINFLLPFVIRIGVNRLLRRIKDFTGHVGNVTLTPSRIIIKAIQIDKIDSTTQLQSPFFSAESIEIGLDYKQLWAGTVICQVLTDKPIIGFVRQATSPKNGTTAKGKGIFIPFTITHFELINGVIEYRDTETTPPVAVSATSVEISCNGITNIAGSELLPCKAEVKATIAKGKLAATMAMDFFTPFPQFDVNLELKDMDLVLFNNFFEAYGHFTLKQGSMEIFSEIAAREGRFTGYVKPLIQNIELTETQVPKTGFLNWLKNEMIETVAEFFENSKNDQIGTKIPFKGTFKNPQVNVVYAIGETLYNAFICALQPAIDNEINIHSVNK